MTFQDAAASLLTLITTQFPDGQVKIIATKEDKPGTAKPDQPGSERQQTTVTVDIWFDLEGTALADRHREVSDYIRDNYPKAAARFRPRIRMNYRGRLVPQSKEPKPGEVAPVSSQVRASKVLERWALYRAGGQFRSAGNVAPGNNEGESSIDEPAADYQKVERILAKLPAAAILAEIISQLAHEKKAFHHLKIPARDLHEIIRTVQAKVQEVVELEAAEERVRVQLVEFAEPAATNTFSETG